MLAISKMVTSPNWCQCSNLERKFMLLKTIKNVSLHLSQVQNALKKCSYFMEEAFTCESSLDKINKERSFHKYRISPRSMTDTLQFPLQLLTIHVIRIQKYKHRLSKVVHDSVHHLERGKCNAKVERYMVSLHESVGGNYIRLYPMGFN